MKIPLENIEAEILANWLRANNYKFTHIANESGLPPRVAMLSALRKKRMGLSPGFPDFCIVLKTKKALLFIELKRQKKILKNGKVGASPSIISDEQIEWIDALNGIGECEACVCYGADEAIRKIQEVEEL